MYTRGKLSFFSLTSLKKTRAVLLVIESAVKPTVLPTTLSLIHLDDLVIASIYVKTVYFFPA